MSRDSEMYRIRITFAKLDALRFIGHLDLAKTWERVLRRASIPLVYSQGFNPQPKMQLASALPLGISSECEVLDIWVLEPIDLGDLPARLEAVSPVGLQVRKVEEVSLREPALQTVLTQAEYRITIDGVSVEELTTHIEEFLAQSAVVRKKRGKEYDLRPLVLALRQQDGVLLTSLTIGNQGNARPDDLLDAMGLSFEDARCHRIGLGIAPAEV